MNTASNDSDPQAGGLAGAAGWLAAITLLIALGGCDTSKGPRQGLFGAPPDPSDVARAAFNDYDADVRRSAIDWLSIADFGGEAVYLRLYRLRLADVDPTVRAAAIKALGMHGTIEDVPALVRGLSEEAEFVRWEAAKALQKIHAPALAPAPLMSVLSRDEDPDVRIAAADALGQYAAPAVFNALVEALDDRDHGVVHAAHRSLRLLTGVDHGLDPRPWVAWAGDIGASLFEGRQPYRWRPYEKPATMGERVLFWREHQRPEPQPPRGLPDVTSDAADVESPRS